MRSTIFNFFRPAPHLEEKENNEKLYHKYRWSVFISATLGYSLYYVCRLSLNVVKKPIVESGLFSESELGLIGSALFFSYAAGKLTNGFLADRSNIRKFLSIGLLLSALINLVLGFVTSFVFFAILWGMNGWFQSMGPSSCVVGLSRWFNNKDRGSFYGFWSASHNIGEAITFVVVALVASSFGWRWGFRGAGIAGLAGVVLVWTCFYDSPESKGVRIPSPDVIPQQEKEAKVSYSAAQKKVLTNPYIWILALSSSCMYISRYAVNSWGIFFLESYKGYSNIQASSIISVSSICGILGTVLSGVVSDRFFRSRRNMPALIFGILNTVGLCIFLYVPAGHWGWDIVAMVIFGISIGVLICYLGGLMAVDIAPQKASGAALGVVGIASYLGAGIQDFVSGMLIEGHKTMTGDSCTYDFSAVSFFWVAASVISFLLATLVWKARSN